MDEREYKAPAPEVSERFTSHSIHNDETRDTVFTGDTTYASDGTQYGYFLDEPDMPVEEKRDRRGESVWWVFPALQWPPLISIACIAILCILD